METIKEFLSSTRNMILAITTILGFIGTLAGGVFWVDDRYAKASEVEQLEERLTLAELKDQLRLALEEYHFLKSQSRKYPDDEDIKEELAEAKETVKDLKDQIKKYRRS